MEVQKNDSEIEVQPTLAGQITPRVGLTRTAGQWRVWVGRILGNRKAAAGVIILLIFALAAILAPVIAPGNPTKFVDIPNLPPSSKHLLGTTGQGQDMLQQLLWGARVSLSVAFIVGVLTTLLSAAVGMTSAYFGGMVDELLQLITNIFLIIPGLPLLVILVSFLPPGAVTIVIVLSITGWSWGARVLRSQALSLREKDFVAAAIVSGESSWRIIFREILPNMWSIVVANFIGSAIYTIGAEAALEFLGLGNVSAVTWGTILYWAENNSGLLQGAWWTFVPAGLSIALVAFALALINYSMDEITNPRLLAVKETRNVLKKYRALRASRATPVVRDAS